MTFITNPFHPGNGITPPFLAGRGGEIKWFKKSLETALTLPQNMIISGIRGTGKTVLLTEFEKICQAKKWLILRKEFNERHCHTEEFVIDLLADLSPKLKGISFLSHKKREIGFLRGASKETLTHESLLDALNQYGGTLGTKLVNLFEELSPIITTAKMRGLVLLLDEFHNVKDGEIEKNYPLSLFLEAFSTLQQKHLKYYLVLSGLPPLFPTLVKAKTYSERMFSVWHLENLKEKDARNAISFPLKRVHRRFSEDLIEKIISLTYGYPYLIQFFCYFLLENIPKKTLALSDLSKILPFLYDQLDNSFFKGRFSQTTLGEQGVLFAILASGTPASPQGIKSHLKISRSDLAQRLDSLCHKGLLYKMSHGQYTFALPAFNQFLSREAKRG